MDYWINGFIEVSCASTAQPTWAYSYYAATQVHTDLKLAYAN